jgi:toxin ParE1/3/4
MFRLSYRASAVRDLRKIAAATRQKWDLDQARSYGDGLRKDIKSLRQFPLRFPLHGGAGAAKLRKMRSGHHLVFYLVEDDAVEIVRVLHERIAVETRLGN